MEKKFILITGATDGIGKQAALELAGENHKIILHGRSEEKLESVIDEIRGIITNADLDSIVFDLASQSAIRKGADKLKLLYDRLDIVINNAGTFKKERELTEDNIEYTFAVNHLAPFLLTHELIPLLEKSDSAQIINVSSMAHQSASLDFDNLQGEKEYSGYSAYALSKLGNLIFTYELAEKLSQKNIRVNALHPGVINTKLLRESFGGGGSSLQKGAETIVYLADSDEVENRTGKYFVSKKEKKSSSLSRDEKLRKKFWRLSEELTGINNYI